jgi:hypothetical protein
MFQVEFEGEMVGFVEGSQSEVMNGLFEPSIPSIFRQI